MEFALENENRNDSVLGTLTGELGIYLQRFLKNLGNTDLEKQLHNYSAVSPEPAC